jgi:hydrogenase maturation protease
VHNANLKIVNPSRGIFETGKGSTRKLKMTTQEFKRKLAAILSADVEGYSRLMDDDEEATVRTLTIYRNAITDLTQQFRGRVVDSLGDNILAEFSSVVDIIRNQGKPGDLYRLESDCIPERIRAKNSLHQVDFLETLTLCQTLDKVPKTVILGVEPEDIETLSTELTPIARSRVNPIINKVLHEIKRLRGSYRKRMDD